MLEQQPNAGGDCGLVASGRAHRDVDAHIPLHVGGQSPVSSGRSSRVGCASQDERCALLNSAKRRVVVAVLDGACDRLAGRRGRGGHGNLKLKVLRKRVGKHLLKIERRGVGVGVLGGQRTADVQKKVATVFGHMFGELSESGVGDVGVRDELGLDDRDAHVLRGPRRHVLVRSVRLPRRAGVENDGPGDLQLTQ